MSRVGPLTPGEPTVEVETLPRDGRVIALEDGARVLFVPKFYAPDVAQAILGALTAEVPFRQRSIQMFGRAVLEPRLTAYVGDPGTAYTYSGRRNEPLVWMPTLAQIRDDLAGAGIGGFNAVLCNLYRDGSDAMGLHRDAEPELGPDPRIASLSFGATRRFRLRHVTRKREGIDLDLPSGSLLVMEGAVQRAYRHGVIRTKQAGPRINLSYRTVVTD